MTKTIDEIIAEWNQGALASTILRHLAAAGESGEPMPEIVCLCGSGRFREAFEQAEFDETLAGRIVLTIGCNTKDIARTTDLAHHKPMLDELHKRKIDLCDRVHVLNVGGYIGSSTRSEIEYATKLGKPITYLEPVDVPASIAAGKPVEAWSSHNWFSKERADHISDAAKKVEAEPERMTVWIDVSGQDFWIGRNKPYWVDDQQANAIPVPLIRVGDRWELDVLQAFRSQTAQGCDTADLADCSDRDKDRTIATLTRERDKLASENDGYRSAFDDQHSEIARLMRENATLTREMDAYKKAKAENDERFQTERDEARARAVLAEADNAAMVQGYEAWQKEPHYLSGKDQGADASLDAVMRKPHPGQLLLDEMAELREANIVMAKAKT